MTEFLRRPDSRGATPRWSVAEWRDLFSSIGYAVVEKRSLHYASLQRGYNPRDSASVGTTAICDSPTVAEERRKSWGV